MPLLEKLKLNLQNEQLQNGTKLEEAALSAVCYVETYHNYPRGYYASNPIPPYTKQAIIIIIEFLRAHQDCSIEDLIASNARNKVHFINTVNILLNIGKKECRLETLDHKRICND